MKSTHEVLVLKISDLKKHPNADTLDIISFPEVGFQVVSKNGNYKVGDLVAYCQPDSLLPISEPEFAFLASGDKTHHRLGNKKLRGEYSMGLIIPARSGWAEGQEVSGELGVIRYEAPEQGVSGGPNRIKGVPSNTVSPPVFVSKYDLENYRKYKSLLDLSKPVYCTEKLEGQNWRTTVVNGEIFVGSRSNWWENVEGNVFWEALPKEISEVAKLHEGLVFYGESVGKVKGFNYSFQDGKEHALLFDIFDLKTNKFFDAIKFWEFVNLWSLPAVPLLKSGIITEEEIFQMAEGKSILASHIREGVVITPEIEEWNPKIGRIKLKLVGNGYLEKV